MCYLLILNRFADVHHFTDLAKFALLFIQNNFPQICLEEEFLELPKKYVIELLSSEYLRVDSESQVSKLHLKEIFSFKICSLLTICIN